MGSVLTISHSSQQNCLSLCAGGPSVLVARDCPPPASCPPRDSALKLDAGMKFDEDPAHAQLAGTLR